MEDNPYNVLASIYDHFQKRADTERFFDNILDEVMRRVPNGDREQKPLVCDLGCGTGDMALLLAQSNYEVIGLDQSSHMINIAHNKLMDRGCHGKFICRDITGFDIPDRADIFLCLTDTINHIQDLTDVNNMFSSVSQSLKKGGIFIFDVLTLDYMEKTLGNNSFCFEEDNYVLVWKNSFDAEAMRSQSDLLLFEGTQVGLYRRSDCVVREVYYSEEQITALLSQTQMRCVNVKDFNDWFEDDKRAVRQIYVAQRT